MTHSGLITARGGVMFYMRASNNGPYDSYMPLQDIVDEREVAKTPEKLLAAAGVLFGGITRFTLSLLRAQ